MGYINTRESLKSCFNDNMSSKSIYLKIKMFLKGRNKNLTTSLILSKAGRIGTNANQKVLAQNWGQDTGHRDTEIHTGSCKDLLRK